MITSEPSICVIMPVFNGEKYLGESIESILNQSYSDFILLIINDGSFDNTEKIIQKCALKDSRIHVINRFANFGLVDALNLGLSLTKAKYIARMDADDISLPNRLALQKQFLDTHPEIGVLGSNLHFIDSSGKRISNFINNPILPRTPNQIYWTLCFSCCLMHPTIMARRDLLIQAGGYRKEAIHAEDYDLWTRLAKTTKFYNLPEKLLLLRRHDKNVTVVHSDTSLKNSQIISSRFISSILQEDVSLEIVRFFWGTIELTKSDAQEIVFFFDHLFRRFSASTILDSNEISYIRKDISERVFLISRLNGSKAGKDLLLNYAIKINFSEVVIKSIVQFFRKIWKVLKNSMN